MSENGHTHKRDTHQSKKQTADVSSDVGLETTYAENDLGPLLQRMHDTPDTLSSKDILQLQRKFGNQAIVNILQGQRKPTGSPADFITSGIQPVVQRQYDDDTYLTTPYPATHQPPDFEYWVNSMWKEVKDVNTKKAVISLLSDKTDTPKAGGSLGVDIKKAVMDKLFAQAYQQKAWVTSTQLLMDNALTHRIEAPKGDKNSKETETIAAGFHGTLRDPNTVLNVHKGTIPTIERHGKDQSDKAGIQAYLKDKLGIGEWHPFWFDGDISQRPFLFRNKQEDNELDTTISVANSAFDSLDFPMPEQDAMLMVPEAQREYNDDGLRIITNYVYLVGVSGGYNTRAMQGKNAFGSGEIATQQLLPDDHLGWIKYRRVFAGASRNDGYKYEKLDEGILPGAEKRGIADQVRSIMSGMPQSGKQHNPMDMTTVYAEMKKYGQELGAKKVHDSKTTVQAWKNYGLLRNHPHIKTAPSPKAKRERFRAFLWGVDDVRKTDDSKTLHTQVPETMFNDEAGPK